MQDYSQELLYEALQLSESVFSEGEDVFQNVYDGEVSDYVIIEDIRNRIISETLEEGNIIYPEELDGFEDLGGEEAVRFFYDAEFNGSEGISQELEVPSELEDVVDVGDGSVSYEVEALPYLLIVEEAVHLSKEDTEFAQDYEDSVRQGSHEASVGDVSQSSDNTEAGSQEIGVEDGSENGSEDKISELEGIWQEVTGAEE